MTTNSASFNQPEYLALSEEEFVLISRLIYERFGINLTEKKKALVRGRLNRLIRSQGFGSFKEYYSAVVADQTGQSLLSMVDKISTNHTFFHREADHFRFMSETILPEISMETNDLRIWCAGCASGEEAYTVAMTVCDTLAGGSQEVGILGTDISLSALEEAESGEYDDERLKFLPPKWRESYFRRTADGKYAVVKQLKEMVMFRRLNLMRDAYPFKGRFHIIFCRNVMIYFDKKTRRSLVSRFHRYMHEGAYLFIGHSESLGREDTLFQYIRPTVYRKC
jgi:chemotaxis protein methyltransferase CheR